jgi:hypothetical protein
MDKASQQRLAETEVIFRKTNQHVADFIVEEEGVGTATTVPFYCECSNNDCHARIRLTPQAYTQFHTSKRQFIVKAGHDVPEIEKIINQHKDFCVVEKYGDPPEPEDINRVLKRLKV